MANWSADVVNKSTGEGRHYEHIDTIPSSRSSGSYENEHNHPSMPPVGVIGKAHMGSQSKAPAKEGESSFPHTEVWGP